jgi:hypothetical protein
MAGLGQTETQRHLSGASASEAIPDVKPRKADSKIPTTPFAPANTFPNQHPIPTQKRTPPEQIMQTVCKPGLFFREKQKETP